MGGQALEEGHETKSRTHVQLSGETCEAGLTIDGRKDVKGELFWLFYDDVFSRWIPPNHVMVFQTLKQAARKSLRRTEKRKRVTKGARDALTRRVL